jgi:pyruvate dehydrogenase E2 component (dihydrolipoamide acetyltransferase)
MSDVLMPQMGESITEGTIVRWMKGVGDAVDKDEPLFEISTDKVDAEIPSPDAGVIAEIRVREGETVPVHTVVAVIRGALGAVGAQGASGMSGAGAVSAPRSPIAGTAHAAAAPAGPGPSTAPQVPVPAAPGAPTDPKAPFLSPVVKRMVATHQLDLSQVVGTGASGRITKKDVDTFLAAASAPAAQASVKPALYQPGDDVRVEKMSVMRRKIADRMLTSLQTSAHIYSAYEVDFSRVADLRKAHKARYEADGANLTYTAFMAQAVAATLRECPYANASVDGDQIVYRNDINLGIAVALEQGLIVPVIRHADRKSLRDLCVAIADLAQRARMKQLKVEDVEAGTFTITNPGVFGGLWGLPIISQPQVAILAVGSIDKRAVVVDDQVVVRPMAYITLGYDHRLIDGADGGRFLQALKNRLEQYDESLL